MGAAVVAAAVMIGAQVADAVVERQAVKAQPKAVKPFRRVERDAQHKALAHLFTFDAGCGEGAKAAA